MPAILYDQIDPPRSSYTVSDLIASVRSDLQGSARILADSDVIRWAQRAQDRLAAESFWFWRSDTLPTIAAQAEYTLPFRSVSITDVRYNLNALAITNLAQLTQLNYNWRRISSGTPIRYYTVGASQFGLFPPPGSGGTTDLIVYYYALPPLVSSPDDQYYVPNGYDHLIETFCKLRASDKDARGDGAPRIPGYQREWFEGVAALKQAVAGFGESNVFGMGENALYDNLNTNRPLVGISPFTNVSPAT